MMIDTGSPVNIIDEATFSKLNIAQEKIYKPSCRLYGFGGSSPIKLIGAFQREISKGNSSMKRL